MIKIIVNRVGCNAIAIAPFKHIKRVAEPLSRSALPSWSVGTMKHIKRVAEPLSRSALSS